MMGRRHTREDSTTQPNEECRTENLNRKETQFPSGNQLVHGGLRLDLETSKPFQSFDPPPPLGPRLSSFQNSINHVGDTGGRLPL